MTGLDCLKEEMKNRGLNQAQCDSKVVAAIAKANLEAA